MLEKVLSLWEIIAQSNIMWTGDVNITIGDDAVLMVCLTVLVCALIRKLL